MVRGFGGVWCRGEGENVPDLEGDPLQGRGVALLCSSALIRWGLRLLGGGGDGGRDGEKNKMQKEEKTQLLGELRAARLG